MPFRESGLSAELEKWIGRYEKTGRRNRHMWDWTWRGIDAMTLPSVDTDWRDHVNTTKFLGVMLVVLLDDVADEHGSKIQKKADEAGKSPEPS